MNDFYSVEYKYHTTMLHNITDNQAKKSQQNGFSADKITESFN